MDVQLALREALEMCDAPDPDRPYIVERLRAVADWIDKGGFLPSVQYIGAFTYCLPDPITEPPDDS